MKIQLGHTSNRNALRCRCGDFGLVFARITAFASVIAVLALAATVAAQQLQPALLSSEQTAAVDLAMRQEMERQEVVGLAVGIIHEGNVAYLKGYGFADREAETPVTTGTMFRWASISKTLTAVAAMQLVEQDLLDLQADVRTYVPEFPNHGALITPRDLLCHQGGIVHYRNGKVIRTQREYDSANPFVDVITALDTFKESPLVCQPREKFSYTTHGYILLSGVVERAGEKRFADQVADRIVQPLGLATLRPDYQWVDIPERAVGYRRFGGAVVRSTDTDVSWKLGGGGFISSVEDLARYAAGLMNGKLVGEATQARMWTPQSTASGESTAMALGFRVETTDGRLQVSHGGSQEKVKSRMVFYPREGRGVVVMSNSEYADPNKFSAAAWAVLGGEAIAAKAAGPGM